jgi:hypothetical protein
MSLKSTQYVCTWEAGMKASIVDLRRRMGEVLRALERNEAVKILYRGRERAIMIPSGATHRKSGPISEHPAFGMWKDRTDMEEIEAHIHELRQGRFHAD